MPAFMKRNKFAHALVEGATLEEAAKKAGIKRSSAGNISQRPDVIAKVEEGLSDAAIAAGVSKAWLIAKLKEVAERCMQAEPILDKLGHETGFWKFDAGGANRSLELIGKHLRVFGEDASTSAQLGAAVIRVLAQEAQAGRAKAAAESAPSEPPTSDVHTSVILPNTSEQDTGPIPENLNVLAPGMADHPARNEDIASPPVVMENDPPTP